MLKWTWLDLRSSLRAKICAVDLYCTRNRFCDVYKYTLINDKVYVYINVSELRNIKPVTMTSSESITQILSSNSQPFHYNSTCLKNVSCVIVFILEEQTFLF